jgi:hypothetical protein
VMNGGVLESIRALDNIISARVVKFS